MKKLYLGNGDKQFKFADTTTEIHLNALDDGSAADLTTNAKVRIKNDSGYLLGISANIKDNHATITSGQLANLPAGSYLIELWDTVNGGTAIYPSDGFLTLQINDNVTGLSGGLISSITVDDFVQQFSSLSDQLKNQVSEAIANGLKGEIGDDGLSAYQVAVINGYQGSQTEWLASLVGAKGGKGEKGDPGKDFRIVKTFPSIAEMNGDGFSDGDFTMIASDVNDPDDGKLYVWNGTSFTYVADLSGSQGIKGDTGAKGDKGDKGDTGEQGLSAYQIAVNAGFSGSVNQWLASLVGDTGTVDNDGLINAPAFQSLQTQVDNSAVGINLLTGTGYHTATTPDTYSKLFNETTDDLLTLFKGLEGQTVTVSVDYEYSGFIAGSGQNRLGWEIQITADTTTYPSTWYYPSNDSGSGRMSSTFVLPKNITTIGESLGYIRFSGSGTGTLSHLKLEKGSKATDWCPNPSEILTQSDYAKIKAAIVALGGALS